MKLSRAVLCLIAMLGLSNVEAYKCHIRCAPEAQRAYKDCEGMEKLSLECESVGNLYRDCTEKCRAQMLKEQERENEAKNERVRQSILRKQKLMPKGQKH